MREIGVDFGPTYFTPCNKDLSMVMTYDSLEGCNKVSIQKIMTASMCHEESISIHQYHRWEAKTR